MQIAIKGTNLDLTPSIKQYVEEKIGNLEKYLNGVLEAKVELERDRHHHTGEVFRAEVMLIIGGKILRADASSEDIYASLDMVIPKLKEQISKFKDKRTTLQKRGARSAKKKF
ncbi:MAG TPA: ribosome-associated translation inhibitor RaiA [Patescibacteria group bacterium]|jgi:putative sigma-54 modulation protein|nr:ribosome-associated translation inhibitor RaiA [Patescibacteria group bacterium]